MNNLPLYQQIYNYIYDRITTGLLKPNDKLPTEKELMEMFIVSRITAKNALNKLRADGYIKRIRGKGSFVCSNVNNDACGNTHTKLVALILGDDEFTHNHDLLSTLKQELEKVGFHLVFKRSYISKESEITALKDLIALGVKGAKIHTLHGELYREDSN